MIYDASLDELLQKVWDGRRINQAEALRLYRLPLEELGALADRRRQLARAAAYGGRGNEIVTYIVDRNINYTNVCNVYCKFCAFYRTEKDDDSYVITLEEMDQKIEETIALGGTQILLQGGHHPKLTKQWYLDLLAHMKGKFPQVNIHGFSPSEFVHFREVFNEPLETHHRRFPSRGPGFDSRRGGRDSRGPGAETDFTAQGDERRLAPGDGRRPPARVELLGHHDVRPRRGVEDRMEHLERVRAQRTRPRGSRRSSVGPSRRSTQAARADGGRARVFADSGLARIYLETSQRAESWVTQGQEIGQVALKYGANDLGSIMIEENVVSQAGTTFRMPASDMRRLISELGYEPHQRDNWYLVVNLIYSQSPFRSKNVVENNFFGFPQERHGHGQWREDQHN